MINTKPWMCPSGKHVLGQVVRNGRKVRQVLLYRNAVDVLADAAAEVDIIATLEGHVMDVRCDICGCVRTWVPGEDALQAMLTRLRKDASYDQVDQSSRSKLEHDGLPAVPAALCADGA